MTAVDKRPFSARFLQFRFEYASLAWDCAAAACTNRFRWHARLVALLMLPLLLALPAAILVVGAKPFGNPYAFSASLVFWPFLLEVPGRMVRQAEIAAEQPDDPSKFDFFLFALFTIIAGAAQILLLFVLDVRTLSHVLLGIVWGVALAGGLDGARTGVASFLVATKGYPLYGHRPLKPPS